MLVRGSWENLNNHNSHKIISIDEIDTSICIMYVITDYRNKYGLYLHFVFKVETIVREYMKKE